MEAALHAGASGLRAASKRFAASASNTVNAASESYTPGRVVQTSPAGGGVKAEAVPVSPATVPVYAPQSPAADADGMVQRPNVEPESEAVEQMLAQRAFEANLRMVQTADDMTRTVLDILA